MKPKQREESPFVSAGSVQGGFINAIFIFRVYGIPGMIMGQWVRNTTA
jgi:hypothetical protein